MDVWNYFNFAKSFKMILIRFQKSAIPMNEIPLNFDNFWREARSTYKFKFENHSNRSIILFVLEWKHIESGLVRSKSTARKFTETAKRIRWDMRIAHACLMRQIKKNPHAFSVLGKLQKFLVLTNRLNSWAGRSKQCVMLLLHQHHSTEEDQQ